MNKKLIVLLLVAVALSGCASKHDTVPVYSVTFSDGSIGAADAFAIAPKMFREAKQ